VKATTHNGRLTTDHSRIWLLVGLGVVLIWAIPSLRYPIHQDQATYCVIGEGLLNGRQPYRDLWDNKPPGIFYVYAVIVKLFGPVMWSVGVVDILWLLVISLCIFYFARRYLGVPAAALSMVFYAVKHTRQGYVHAAQPETFMMLCVFAGYLWLLPEHRWPRWRAAAAGLMLGAAFWLKYTVVLFFPLVAILPFLELHGPGGQSPGSFGPPPLSPLPDENWKRGRPHVSRWRSLRLLISSREWLARVGIGTVAFAGCVGGVLGYLVWVGVWPAFREEQFEVMPRYGATALQAGLPFLRRAIDLTGGHIGVWTEVMFALTFLVAWWRRELLLVTPVLLMALAGYVAAAMQGRFHPYYFETCYPFLAMCWGYISVKAYQAFRFGFSLLTKRGWRLARVLLCVLFANLVLALLPEESVRLVQHYELLADWWRNPRQSYADYWWQHPLAKFPDQLRVIDYLKENSRPGDLVYVWGTAPLINFLSRRDSPSRFVCNLPLISTWGPDRWHGELVQDLERFRPRFIVVERHDSIPNVSQNWRDSEEELQFYPALADLLRNQYQPAVNYNDFEIYQSRSIEARDSKVQN